MTFNPKAARLAILAEYHAHLAGSDTATVDQYNHTYTTIHAATGGGGEPAEPAAPTAPGPPKVEPAGPTKPSGTLAEHPEASATLAKPAQPPAAKKLRPTLADYQNAGRLQGVNPATAGKTAHEPSGKATGGQFAKAAAAWSPKAIAGEMGSQAVPTPKQEAGAGTLVDMVKKTQAKGGPPQAPGTRRISGAPKGAMFAGADDIAKNTNPDRQVRPGATNYVQPEKAEPTAREAQDLVDRRAKLAEQIAAGKARRQKATEGNEGEKAKDKWDERERLKAGIEAGQVRQAEGMAKIAKGEAKAEKKRLGDRRQTLEGVPERERPIGMQHVDTALKALGVENESDPAHLQELARHLGIKNSTKIFYPRQLADAIHQNSHLNADHPSAEDPNFINPPPPAPAPDPAAITPGPVASPSLALPIPGKWGEAINKLLGRKPEPEPAAAKAPAKKAAAKPPAVNAFAKLRTILADSGIDDSALKPHTYAAPLPVTVTPYTFAEMAAHYAARLPSQFTQQMSLWDEGKHPRQDKGAAIGGQFKSGSAKTPDLATHVAQQKAAKAKGDPTQTPEYVARIKKGTEVEAARDKKQADEVKARHPATLKKIEDHQPVWKKDDEGNEYRTTEATPHIQAHPGGNGKRSATYWHIIEEDSGVILAQLRKNEVAGWLIRNSMSEASKAAEAEPAKAEPAAETFTEAVKKKAGPLSMTDRPAWIKEQAEKTHSLLNDQTEADAKYGRVKEGRTGAWWKKLEATDDAKQLQAMREKHNDNPPKIRGGGGAIDYHQREARDEALQARIKSRDAGRQVGRIGQKLHGTDRQAFEDHLAKAANATKGPGVTDSIKSGLSSAEHQEALFDLHRNDTITEAQLDQALNQMPKPGDWNHAAKLDGKTVHVSMPHLKRPVIGKVTGMEINKAGDIHGQPGGAGGRDHARLVLKVKGSDGKTYTITPDEAVTLTSKIGHDLKKGRVDAAYLDHPAVEEMLGDLAATVSDGNSVGDVIRNTFGEMAVRSRLPIHKAIAEKYEKLRDEKAAKRATPSAGRAAAQAKRAAADKPAVKDLTAHRARLIAKARAWDQKQAKAGFTITDVTPAGYGPEPAEPEPEASPGIKMPTKEKATADPGDQAGLFGGGYRKEKKKTGGDIGKNKPQGKQPKMFDRMNDDPDQGGLFAAAVNACVDRYAFDAGKHPRGDKGRFTLLHGRYGKDNKEEYKEISHHEHRHEAEDAGLDGLTDGYYFTKVRDNTPEAGPGKTREQARHDSYAAADRYDAGAQWRTIGADKSQPAGEQGGTPVAIGPGGHITAGPASMVGHHVEAIGGPVEKPELQQQPAPPPKQQAKPTQAGTTREVGGRQAYKPGRDAAGSRTKKTGDVYRVPERQNFKDGLANLGIDNTPANQWAFRQFLKPALEAVNESRLSQIEALRNLVANPQQISGLLKRVKNAEDYDKIKGFDELARTAESLPAIFVTEGATGASDKQGDSEGRLFRALKALGGSSPRKARKFDDETMRTALAMMEREGGLAEITKGYRRGGPKTPDPVTGATTGPVDEWGEPVEPEDEAVPFGALSEREQSAERFAMAIDYYGALADAADDRPDTFAAAVGAICEQYAGRGVSPGQMSLFGNDPMTRSKKLKKISWDESKHPRKPKGQAGGEFTTGTGGSPADTTATPEPTPGQGAHDNTGQLLSDDEAQQRRDFWNSKAAKSGDKMPPPPPKPEPADPEPEPADPEPEAVEATGPPVITEEMIGTDPGQYDMMHSGLASRFVQGKIAEGMKGIQGREYGLYEHAGGKWQLVSRPGQAAAADDAEETTDEPAAETEPEIPTPEPGTTPPSADDQKDAEPPKPSPELKKSQAEADRKTPPPDKPKKDGTPRQQSAHGIQEADPDYDYARASRVGNVGEDLKGSARHKANQWRDLDEAEADGSAEAMVKRDKLLKNEPHAVGVHLDSNPMATLAMNEAMRAFPAKPGYGNRSRTSDEKKQNRAQYLDAYRRISEKATEIAGGDEENPLTANRELGQFVSKLIDEYRKTSRYNETGNGLISLANRLNGRGRKSLGVKVAEFLHDLTSKGPDGATGPETRQMIVDATAKALDGKTLTSMMEAVSGKPKRFKDKDAPVKKVKRTGGKDLGFKSGDGDKAAKFLADKAGLRGLQYGNTMSDQERDHHSRLTAEALVDLADVVGVPLKEVSLGGKLGLAFGARGIMGAAAHYEPGNNVINLTRANGAGSLAHEWGHALDHHMSPGDDMAGMIDSRGRPAGASYASMQPLETRTGKKGPDGKWTSTVTDHTKEPTYKAMQGIRDALDSSGYNTRLHETIGEMRKSGELAKSGKGIGSAAYYRDPIEVFARAFEKHVQHSLQSKDRENTYLSGRGEHPLWPTMEEAAKMAPAFDALMTEYRKQSTGSTEAHEYTAAERAQIIDLATDWRPGHPIPGTFAAAVHTATKTRSPTH